MIVKCEQCQTRFKIPDDKVTDKGVKVRCTKCQHTFRVKREPAAEAVAAVDPFAKFGGTEGSSGGEETRPGMFALGVEASRLPDLRVTVSGPPLLPLASTQTDVPRQIFEQPTAVRAAPPPPPGRRPLSDPAPAPFDFSAPPVEEGPSPFDFTAPGRPPDPAPFDFAAPPPAASGPFDFGQAPSSGGAAASPFDFASLGEVSPPPAQARTERVALPPAAVRQAAARSAPTGTATQPALPAPAMFDFGALPPAPAPPPMPRAAPSAPRAETPMFDFGALAQEPPVAAPAPAPPPLTKAQPETAQVSFAKASAPRAAEPGPDLGAFFESAPPPSAPQPEPAGSSLLPDVSDFFGQSPGGLETGEGVSAENGSRGNLFDMPAPLPEPPVAPAPTAAAPENNVAVAKIALRRVTADGVQVPRPGAADAETSSERRRRVLRVVANVVAGVVVGAVLLGVGAVALNDGKFDGASLGKLGSQRQGLVAVDISNGLYQTKTGRPIFYVRGLVENRSTSPGRVKVRAEIFDKDQLVRAAEGYAGAAPSPEDLNAIDGARGLEQLLARLAGDAKEVATGAKVPFVVAFYEYPPDLKGYQVKVSVDAASSSRAER